MSSEDRKARDEFEAWAKSEAGSEFSDVVRLDENGEYLTEHHRRDWLVWQESRRTYRATVLEEAAKVAQAEPRVWDQSAPDPQTRIATKIRALIAKEG